MRFSVWHGRPARATEFANDRDTRTSKRRNQSQGRLCPKPQRISAKSQSRKVAKAEAFRAKR